jgi:ABC-type Mn2+/Zn2+ transport system ATPase subunit
MDNPAILVDSITVDYNGFVALSDARLRVPSGAICALVGMNGAGKSTLFKAIMGFLTPASGRVLIEGAPVATAQKAGRLAYMPQAEEVDWAFPVNVQDVVMMGRYGFMNILRTPRKLDKQKVAQSLERVGMHDFRTRQISELSGGQRKRAFLARALAQDARIMLLDEPFTGIDAKTEEAMIVLLRELRDEGCTVVICTHDLASIESFCDEVALTTAPCWPTVRWRRPSRPKILPAPTAESSTIWSSIAARARQLLARRTSGTPTATRPRRCRRRGGSHDSDHLALDQ